MVLNLLSLCFGWGSGGDEQQESAVQTKEALKVMIAGAPAAGKGTQCASIVQKVRGPAALREGAALLSWIHLASGFTLPCQP